MNELLSRSGVALARMIRAREVTSSEVVGAHIEYAEAVNPSLNAIVRERYDAAREEARRFDAAPTDLPFGGVPCTIKESFELTGMPNSSGLVARRDVVAKRDAVTVRRLRDAGAIPIGVTNTSELCMWMESNNRVYGRSNNPYDPTRIVGGSSGGEGAIVGSGASPFGLGADIGGSIRMPAFFNGVFGHKPTGGLVPGTGQYPLAENEALSYLCTGPIARRAEDLWPLLGVLAGPDGADSACRSATLGDPTAVDLSELTVVDVQSNGAIRVSDDLAAAQAGVADVLRDRGARVVKAELKLLERSRDIWSSMLATASETAFGTMLGDGRPVRAMFEIFRWALGRSPHTLPAIALVAIERLNGLLKGRMARFVEAGRRLQAELVELIGPRGVMLYPSYPVPAPRHGRPLLMPFHWVYTGIINVMKFPATQVPLGLNRDGLPLGVQIVGAHHQDHVTVAVAQLLEDVFGGWVPPFSRGGRAR